MGMVSLGPLAIPYSVFSALLAFLTFTLLVSFAARRVDSRLERWSTVALIAGVVVARAGYVVIHWTTFSDTPLRALMLWQGGFEWRSGVAAAIVSTFFILRPWRSRGFAILILVLSALVWAAMGTVFDDTRKSVPLPDVTLRDSGNLDVELHRYSSGPVVLNMWATWCPPCRRELPAMLVQAEASPSVPFLFVNQSEDPAAVQAYLTQEKLVLEHVLFDQGAQLASQLGTVGIPITFFFYDGVMIDLHAGEISPEALRLKTEALVTLFEKK